MNDSVEFGEFLLDQQERRLFRGEEQVHLEPKVFDLLCLLVRSPGSLVDKNALLDALWPDIVVTENSLTRCVHQLRSALGDHAATPRYVETVTGSGYRFLMPVTAGGRAESPPAATKSGLRWRRPHAMAALAIVLVLLLIALVFRDHPNSTEPRLDRLAVLPLANLTGNPDQEYFVRGVHEALIAQLSRLDGVQVVSRTSVMQFRETRSSLEEIAGKLEVDAIVEGSVLQEGERLTVVAQLLAVHPERHLWSGRFDGEAGRLFDITYELASAVASELELDLLEMEHSRSQAGRRLDPEAYDEYLRGQFEFEKRTPQAYRLAEQYFRKAVDLDPEFAPAYVGLAHVLGSAAIFGAVKPADGLPVARVLARRALELDPDVPEARLLLAGVSFYWDWDWDTAESLLRAELRKQPDSAHALRILSEVYSVTGRHDEALASLEQARIIEPLSATSQFKPAYILYLAGRFAEAEELVSARLEHFPQFWIAHHLLCMASSALGDHGQAVAACGDAVSTSGRAPAALGTLGLALARAGDHQAALGVISELETLRAVRYVNAASLAIIFAALGETDAALSQLKQAYEDRDPMLIHAAHSERFSEVRTIPEFEELRRRVISSD